MAANEPNFDVSDLPTGGIEIDDLQMEMVSALEAGTLQFPETDVDGYEIEEAEAAPVEAEEATEEAEEAEASAEEEVEASEEEAPETDETSYPMPELLSFEGEEAGIEIDGEFLPLQSLKDSYYRQSEFSRQMEEVRSAKQQHLTAAQEVAQAQEQYHAGLTQLETLISAQLPTGRTQAEWDQLERDNPQGFIAETKRMRENEATIAQIKAEQERVAAEYQQNAETQRRAALDDMSETLQATVPGWTDPEVMETEAQELVSWLTDEFGLTAEERAGMIDARFWRLAHMAKNGQALQNGAQKVAKKAASPLSKATLKAGRQQTQREKTVAKRKPFNDAIKRAEKTQDINDWGNVFARAIDAGALD